MKHKFFKSPLAILFVFIFILWLPCAIIAYRLGSIPLVPNWRFNVKVKKHSGMSMFTMTYKVLNSEEPFSYFYVNGSWFKVEERGNSMIVYKTNKIFTFPCLSKNSLFTKENPNDQALRDNRLEKWFIHDMAKSVVFSNATLSVSVSKKAPP